MDYSFSEKQEMMRTSARNFLIRECPLKLVRQAEFSDGSFLVVLWKKLAGLGWPGLLIPEEYGGSGGALLDFVVILEEAGRVLLPVPLIPTVAGALGVLWGGSEGLKRKILPQIVSGQIIVTLPVVEPETVGGARFRVARDGDNFSITGVKVFVPDAPMAQYIVCMAETGSGPEDVTILVVETDVPGVTRRPLKTISGSRLYEVTFDDVRVPDNGLLGRFNGGRALAGRVLRHAAVAECAWMVGAARRAFEMAVEYVKTRSQYGRPLATFQTVQHQCADMYVDLRAAEYLTHQAGWKLGKDPDAAWEVSVAKAWVNNACRRIVSRACYLHGALGYSEEYDVQLYLRYVAGAVPAFGDTSYHLEAVARELIV